jgi:hypothetical protein
MLIAFALQQVIVMIYNEQNYCILSHFILYYMPVKGILFAILRLKGIKNRLDTAIFGINALLLPPQIVL